MLFDLLYSWHFISRFFFVPSNIFRSGCHSACSNVHQRLFACARSTFRLSPSELSGVSMLQPNYWNCWHWSLFFRQHLFPASSIHLCPVPGPQATAAAAAAAACQHTRQPTWLPDLQRHSFRAAERAGLGSDQPRCPCWCFKPGFSGHQHVNVAVVWPDGVPHSHLPRALPCCGPPHLLPGP